jgi:hypothetical protein
MEYSMGVASELGKGFKYSEMIVIPFENCSDRVVVSSSTKRLAGGVYAPTYFLAE